MGVDSDMKKYGIDQKHLKFIQGKYGAELYLVSNNENDKAYYANYNALKLQNKYFSASGDHFISKKPLMKFIENVAFSGVDRYPEGTPNKFCQTFRGRNLYITDEDGDNSTTLKQVLFSFYRDTENVRIKATSEENLTEIDFYGTIERISILDFATFTEVSFELNSKGGAKINQMFYIDRDKSDADEFTMKLGFSEFIKSIPSLTGITVEDEIINNDKGDEKMKNFEDRFSALMPKRLNGGIALTMAGGVAIKNADGDYVSYNPVTKQVDNNMDLVFGEDKLSGLAFIMPVNASAIKAGDIVSSGGDFHYVENVDEKTHEASYINLSGATKSTVVPVKNVFTGTAMVSKLFTMFDGMVAGGQTGFNPMMFLMLDRDKNGGVETDKLLNMMLMSQMMSGFTNTNSNTGFDPNMMLFAMM